MSTNQMAKVTGTQRKVPIILNKSVIFKNIDKNRVTLLPGVVKEHVIYKSKPGDFTAGEYRSIKIINRVNTVSKRSEIIAQCESLDGEHYEKNSEDIVKLIGQSSLNILLSSLFSLFNEELKIRSIVSLLTVPKKNIGADPSKKIDVACQTDSIQRVINNNHKKRLRKHPLTPYVVKDTPDVKKPKRIVIEPKDFNTFTSKDTENQDSESILPDLGLIFDEESNSSTGKFSVLSVKTTPDLLMNPLNMLMSNVDKHTIEIENKEMTSTVSMPNTVCVPIMKTDVTHLPQDATMDREQRLRMLMIQGVTTWQSCMTPDQNGHLPIHEAVLTNDVDLLKMQCLVLKMRCSTVDIQSMDGLTPLRLSLFQENTELLSVLLEAGADPLEVDDEDRNAFHITAEMLSDHLPILVNYCLQNARKILQDNTELWKTEYESKTDEELTKKLILHINKTTNSEGYTPLMLASKLGRYNNINALLEHCSEAVDVRMPNSGNTALYIAVGAACMDCLERGNKVKVVDHFKKTVEALMQHGAHPGVENFAGSSINDILTEINVAELSILIANKLTSIKYYNNCLPPDAARCNFMLYKDSTGAVNIQDIKSTGLGKKNISATPPHIVIKHGNTDSKTNEGEPVNSVNTVEPVNSVNAGKPVNSVKPVHTVSSVKPVNSAKPIKIVNCVNLVSPGTKINSVKLLNSVTKVNSVNTINTVKKPIILRSTEKRKNNSKQILILPPKKSKSSNTKD